MLFVLSKVLSSETSSLDISSCYSGLSARIAQNGHFWQISLAFDHQTSDACAALANETMSYTLTFPSKTGTVPMRYSAAAPYSQILVQLSCQLFYCNELQLYTEAVAATLTVQHSSYQNVTAAVQIQPFTGDRGQHFDCFSNILAQQNAETYKTASLSFSTCDQLSGTYRAYLKVYYDSSEHIYSQNVSI